MKEQRSQLIMREFQKVIDNCHAESFDSLRDIIHLQMSYRAGLRAMEIAAFEIIEIYWIQKVKSNAPLHSAKLAPKATGGVAYVSHVELREALSAYSQ